MEKDTFLRKKLNVWSNVAPKSSVRGPRPRKFFLQNFNKVAAVQQKFRSEAPLSHRDFLPFLKNNVFRKFEPISAVIYQEIQNFLHFSMDRAKMAFSRRGPKMSRRRVPTEIFGVSEFFHRKFVEKKFRGRGPQKSTFLGLFSKINPRNFCQLGKNVFFVLPIFLKNRENGGLFLRVRPQNFFSSLY